ncbi:hypothetical protein AB0900_34195 [Streptomyces cellulosae]|uniref:Uncharacterized protein n=1 Tax=Streptomyces thermocarboxydus TaxID=59299 RepID=A0ABU3JGZ0_9ACTN|nr:hypothetical protein [Streptomyces thermocarboxydus]WSB89083.1 hypothetical protein OG805_00215 [Streptomyces cellulosae]WSB95211.1 hypothetical protein OG805_33705 [Streptomyces cellulosae]
MPQPTAYIIGRSHIRTASATHAAGVTHQAPARRLAERPIVYENPSALGP